jgi:hypothetical protein
MGRIALVSQQLYASYDTIAVFDLSVSCHEGIRNVTFNILEIASPQALLLAKRRAIFSIVDMLAASQFSLFDL